MILLSIESIQKTLKRKFGKDTSRIVEKVENHLLT